MTDESDIPWSVGDPPAQLALAHPRRWKHAHNLLRPGSTCALCKLTFEEIEVREKRGRTSLRAGKDAERAIAKAYGGERVGQYGGASDVTVGELFSVQSKVKGNFPAWMWDELAKLPRTGGRIPTLIVSDRPGSGNATRRLVIRTMADDVALHGRLKE